MSRIQTPSLGTATAAQSAQAKSAVLTGLAARDTPNSHIALARRLLHGGPLNVLRTLGR
jgi:hypothetical protein